MATIKSYTDIEQSKQLAKILPIKTADMHYATWTILNGEFIVSPNQGSTIEDLQEDYGNQIIPCWSIAALLDTYKGNIVMYKQQDTNKYHIATKYIGTYVTSDNLIDAVFEMILKLNELKML